jgi:hypothetical protein
LPSNNELPSAGARPAADMRPAPRVFAPQTVPQGRKPWTPPGPGAFARLPIWVIVTGAAGILLIGGFLIALGISAVGRKPATEEPIGAAGGAATESTLLTGRDPDHPLASRAGRLYKGGEVPRSPDKWYVVVFATPAINAKPEDSTAYKHAQFLAEHGVDVSIEAVKDGNQMWYWVVSAKGASSAAAANSFLAQIRKIGDQMSLGAWKGAYARQGLSQKGSESPPR